VPLDKAGPLINVGPIPALLLPPPNAGLAARLAQKGEESLPRVRSPFRTSLNGGKNSTHTGAGDTGGIAVRVVLALRGRAIPGSVCEDSILSGRADKRVPGVPVLVGGPVGLSLGPGVW